MTPLTVHNHREPGIETLARIGTLPIRDAPALWVDGLQCDFLGQDLFPLDVQCSMLGKELLQRGRGQEARQTEGIHARQALALQPRSCDAETDAARGDEVARLAIFPRYTPEA